MFFPPVNAENKVICLHTSSRNTTQVLTVFIYLEYMLQSRIRLSFSRIDCHLSS